MGMYLSYFRNRDASRNYLYVYYLFKDKFLIPINRIVENVETVQEALVSINKVYEILEQKQYLENLERRKNIIQKYRAKLNLEMYGFLMIMKIGY